MLTEELTRQFYEWELRGRGWFSASYPVALEPPFRPFWGYRLPRVSGFDDGRRPTLFERLFGRKASLVAEPEEEEEPPLLPFRVSEPLREFILSVPVSQKVSPDAAEQWLLALSGASLPLSFELLGTSSGLSVHLAAFERDALLLERQIAAFFPEASLVDAPQVSAVA